MGELIYNEIIEIMMRLGIVKTILISSDLYEGLSEAERYKLESVLCCSTKVKWVVSTERTNYYNYLYTQYPVQKKKQDNELHR